MMRIPVLLVAILSTLLAADSFAATKIEDLTPDQRQRIASMIEVDVKSLPPGSYQAVGSAEGASCQRNADSPVPASVEQAKQQMVMKAAMMGANALSGVICQERGTDWKRNCWQTVVCVAEAIAITDEAVLGVGSQHGGGNAQSGRGVPAVAAGSGFFVSTDGFVVTSQHVIEGASKVRVILSDGRRLDADVVASSRATDLAILKVSSASPGMLSLASSRSAKVGQWVFTYGYPVTDVLGSEPKFSDGSISSLSGLRDEHSFMQISVPVQPGNSGGPLVNEKGQVVGVIAAQAAVSRFYEATGTLPQNVNWAVKAEYVALLAELSQAQGETGSRQEAIDRVRRAICRIETEH